MDKKIEEKFKKLESIILSLKVDMLGYQQLTEILTGEKYALQVELKKERSKNDGR
jgi:hypothetical protein